MSYEFDLASEENEFIVVSKDRDEVIKTLTFNQSTLDKLLYDKKDTVHFYKIKAGMLDHLRPDDIKLISEKYFEKTKQKLTILQDYK
ncbi:hypothetical protein [Ureibacillus sinduriensis]|uniref:Uncharacterized protein n=1 Tax=Ureibacillus sinduriensis BLB-1 = JCM 15800 TaxID=1384057 RepID=A0A0A3HXX4_9BACL|nr:hypothetical protein [Ureibacillus sinduriensis]KGR75223.1 hypothetical protein CD33_13240 [Ureibacillus sinduriensis BLB-1 = JCM 15800]